MNKEKFWTWVFYGSLITLTIWLILKVSGFIQSPLWIEYGIPVASLILAILAFFREIMKNFARLEVSLAVLSTRVGHLDKDMEFVKQDIQTLKHSNHSI